MKFLAALAFVFFLMVNQSYAQITLGARAGYGFSSTSLEPTKGVERKIGFSPLAGIIFHYNLDLKFSVGAEVCYNKFSESILYRADSLSGRKLPAVTSLTEISYIQIPITARASIGDKKYRGFLEFGPYIGIGFNGSWNKGPTISYLNNNPDVPSVVRLDTNISYSQKKLRRLDIGGVLGGGVEYKLGNTGLVFFGARVQMGLFNIYNLTSNEQRAFKSVTNYLLPDATWRAVNFSFGYLRTFKLPKLSADPTSKRAGKQKK